MCVIMIFTLIPLLSNFPVQQNPKINNTVQIRKGTMTTNGKPK